MGSVKTPVDAIDVVLRRGGIDWRSGGRPGHHDALSRDARGEVTRRGKRMGQRNANLVRKSGAAARRVQRLGRVGCEVCGVVALKRGGERIDERA